MIRKSGTQGGARNGLRKSRPWDERTREKIKVGRLITNLMKCADGKMEISMTRLRAIEILLRKVVPDLSRVVVQTDVNVRYVVRLPDVLSKEEWLRRYGDPKLIEGSISREDGVLTPDVNEPPETLQ